ncbi:hypothetical protein A6U87_14865 [Rhizobium sp. AC44/96]|uniref:hypothetical protein n=1 Tax=Rhizobium sp. AC44/96 TaxID=1841654 RepID=UPI00080FD360|nr:hypothetical protein [Rhizobium sp. AC44/96]OCJ05283.1 hypothetical protein A6U87_14865 [Rhizobium sp. AC44/96]
MTEREQIYQLRMGLATAIGYLQHFKGDAECNLPSFPDTIQKAIDELESVRRGGSGTPALQSAVVAGAA